MAATSQGKITVTRAGAADALTVNSHASNLPRGVTATVTDGVLTLGGTIGMPPANRPIPAFVVVDDASPSGAVLAEIIQFSDDAVTGHLLAEAKTPCEARGLCRSDLAGLANMSQELTGPHAPYMLIVYVLADKIKSGELKPGDRMPSVTELVGTYNVSHSTARRALAKLKDMGLTDTVPGYATFVRFPDQGVPS